MENEKLIKNIKQILLNEFKDAEAIYIFGSLYDGSFNKNSDIDIALLYKDKIDSLLLFQKQEDLSLLLDRDVDLVDLQDINDVFAYEIINNSIKIKDSKFAEDYELRIWYRYLDLQEDRKEILKAFYG